MVLAQRTTFRSLVILTLILPCCAMLAQEIRSPLPSLRDQATIEGEWLKARLEQVLPKVLRENHIAMWIVPMREYNEDPVFSSLVLPTTFSARRTTIFVFFDRGVQGGVERLALGGTSQGGLYVAYKDTTLKNAELWGDGQWKLLSKIIQERDPGTIAVDISRTHAFSDGLSAGEWDTLREALGPKYLARVVPADRVPLDYIAIRLPEMLSIYKRMMESAHLIIGEAFSNAVIKPGRTTAQDVVWWMRQKAQELGMTTWFQPSVDVQRKGVDLTGVADPTIERGDVLHCDFGLTGMHLNTDTQHMGYVLRNGETDVPTGIKHALSTSNRLQEILLDAMKEGLTGNQVLTNAIEKMKSERIDGAIYSHPIGVHGHGAGPLIGLWDRQAPIPGRGDVPILRNTWYAVELEASTPVPEWGNQVLRSGQEEDAGIGENGLATWILDRQTEYHIVR